MTDDIDLPLPEPEIKREPFQLNRVLNRTFSAFKDNIKFLLMVIGIFWAINLLLLFLTLPLIESMPADESAAPLVAVVAYTIIMTVLFALFISTFSDILSFARFTGRRPKFLESVKRAAKGTVPVLFLCLLYIIAIQIGGILFIVPGVMIALGWAVIGPVYLHEEDTDFFNSFGRSWQLSKGYKLWIWLTKIVMAIIIMLVTLLPSLLILSAKSSIGETGDNFIVDTLISFLSGMFIYAFFSLYSAYTSALYTELVELKEGLPHAE